VSRGLRPLCVGLQRDLGELRWRHGSPVLIIMQMHAVAVHPWDLLQPFTTIACEEETKESLGFTGMTHNAAAVKSDW